MAKTVKGKAGEAEVINPSGIKASNKWTLWTTASGYWEWAGAFDTRAAAEDWAKARSCYTAIVPITLPAIK